MAITDSPTVADPGAARFSFLHAGSITAATGIQVANSVAGKIPRVRRAIFSSSSTKDLLWANTALAVTRFKTRCSNTGLWVIEFNPNGWDWGFAAAEEMWLDVSATGDVWICGEGIYV